MLSHTILAHSFELLNRTSSIHISSESRKLAFYSTNICITSNHTNTLACTQKLRAPHNQHRCVDCWCVQWMLNQSDWSVISVEGSSRHFRTLLWTQRLIRNVRNFLRKNEPLPATMVQHKIQDDFKIRSMNSRYSVLVFHFVVIDGKLWILRLTIRKLSTLILSWPDTKLQWFGDINCRFAFIWCENKWTMSQRSRLTLIYRSDVIVWLFIKKRMK